MLPSPNLSGRIFEDIASRSVKRMEMYAEGWNSDNVHDPGVTIIELLSYLTVKQQESINRVGEKSLRKFLKLLGMSFEGATPAGTYAAFDTKRDTFLPSGTKLEFQGVVFETESCVGVLENEIAETGERYVFGNPSSEGSEFLIGFKKPLPSDASVNIYIDVSEDCGGIRNPVTEPESFAPTSTVRWEYYGKDGWLPLVLEKDETYNLLFPGIVRFRIDGVHMPLEGKWLIRCTLTRDLSETAPIVEGVWLNAARLVQTDTKCRAFIFSRMQLDEDKMPVDCFLGYVGVTELYINEGGFWRRAEELGVKHTLRDRAAGLHLSVSNKEELSVTLGSGDASCGIIKLVLYDGDFYGKRPRINGNGFCGQTLTVPEGTCREGLEIMVSGKRGWSVYEPVDDFDNSKPFDRHFTYSERTRLITFGDNEHGLAPSAGSEIVVTGLKTTLGEGGRIRENSLKWPVNAELIPVCISQHKNADGGRDAETLEETMARIPRELGRVRRAVSCSDYEEIAKGAQGLMLKNVTALPLHSPHGNVDENAVTIVVEPFTNGRQINAPEYLKNVKRALEKSRLLATKVYASFPVWLGLEVYCEIAVEARGICDKAIIAAELIKYIEQLQLGAAVSHSAVCGAIGNVQNVLYTKYLTMEIHGKKGKNALGDIEIPRHARVYVKSLNVTEELP